MSIPMRWCMRGEARPLRTGTWALSLRIFLAGRTCFGVGVSNRERKWDERDAVDALGAVRLKLLKRHHLQADILMSPAKRKVVVAGRRAGKTTLAALGAVELMLDSKKVLITSTTQDQADTFWDKAKLWLRPMLNAKMVVKNENRRVLIFGDTGRIRVKTGSNPDVLRGDDADFIIFDECALLDPAAWYEVAAPMLTDRDGSALFIGTPHRKNWFFHLYQAARDPHNERWQAWHFTTSANPFLSKVAVDELSKEMTEEAYRQEILAEFLDGDGVVFRKVRQAATARHSSPYEGAFVCGLDWAQHRDYTCIVVMDAALGKMVAMDRFNGVDWALQRGRLKALVQKWQPQLIVAEANSIGGPNIEALQREGLPIVPFMTTAQSKTNIIERLVLAFEQGVIRILNDPVLVGELEAYERTIHPYTGQSKYGAPSGMHDDTVMALALAWYGCLQPREEEIVVEKPRLAVVGNPFYGG